MRKSLLNAPCLLFLALSSVFPDLTVSASTILGAIQEMTRHVEGKAILSEDEIKLKKVQVLNQSNLLNTDTVVLDAALNLVDRYEEIHKALFINFKTTGGFSREDELSTDGLELERFIIAFQQAILDEVYHGTSPRDDEYSIIHNADYLRGRKWKTANFFPGYVAPPNDSTIEYSIKIDASMPAFWGRKVCFADEPILKPTGMYLSPGGIATLKVPAKLKNRSFQVQVGASSVDFQKKSLMSRMDRVTSTYAINDTTIKVANPLGGGIYLLVPYLADEGIVSIKITGDVVEAPIFSMTSISQTKAAQWNNNLRRSQAPWADFETDYFLMQVPTIWISGYDFNHFKTVLQGHDKALAGTSRLVGVSIEKRNKHLLYLQPDLQIKHDAYGVGYPQVNNVISSGPNGPLPTGPKGKSTHWFVSKPFLQDGTLWHELGHCIVQSMYRGETEAIVNFLYAYVKNVHMGEEFNFAFKTSQEEDRKFTPDLAAVDWMVTTNFRAGKEMTYDFGVFDQFRYQERGYAKYADIVRLFGWSTFSDFNYNDNVDYYYDNDIGDGLDETDRRTLLLSIAASVDLTPLIHFWGIHAVSDEKLKKKMIEHDLPLSNKVYNLITQRLTLIPKNTEEFISFFKKIYPGQYGADNCESLHYGCGWYNNWSTKYKGKQYRKAVDTGNNILNKYYSCDDKSGEFTIDGTDVTCKDLLGDYKWACNHRTYSDFCPDSCGICDITNVPYPTASPITFEPTPTPSRSFTSRGNILVKYYDVELEKLPASGLISLEHYKTGRVPDINYRVGLGIFAGSEKKDNVAALFESFLDFSAGTYELCITSDDGSKLYIDDALLINNDGSHSEIQLCAFYTASSSTLSKMRIEYFEGGIDATLIFQWKPPGTKLTTVPSDAFINIGCKDTKGKLKLIGKKKRTCAQWYRQGYCKRRKVKKACPFSCKKCPEATESPTPGPSMFGECKDTSGKLNLGGDIPPKKTCVQLWTNGYCDFSKVVKACPVSCGTCPTSAPTPVCEDTKGKLTLGGIIPARKTCLLLKRKYCDFTDVINACPVSCKACGENNVRVKYYDVALTKLPAAGLGSLVHYKSERVPNINYRLHVGEEFAGSGKNEKFAAMFEFSLAFSRGLHNLCIISDDGSKMYIDNVLVLDKDGTHSDGWGCVTYSKPGMRKLRIEYFEATWDATLIFQWELPGSTSRTVVPPKAFLNNV